MRRLAAVGLRCAAWRAHARFNTQGSGTSAERDAVAAVLRSIENAQISDEEARRLATTPSHAPLGEVLGTDPGDLMPEAFHEEEAVDLGLAFIAEVEEMDLPAEDLRRVELLLDCFFDDTSDRDEKLLLAVECLGIAALRESEQCVAFLGKLVHSTLHHCERRTVQTLALHHLGSPELLQRVWLTTDLSAPIDVPFASLKGYLQGDVAAVATVQALLGVGDSAFAAQLDELSKKRKLKILVKEAFKAFAGASPFAEASEVKAAIDTIATEVDADEWKARVDKAADEEGRLRLSNFIDAVVFE